MSRIPTTSSGQSHSVNQDSHEAFVQLTEENYDFIRRCIMALCPDRFQADDIMQETLIILWRKYSTDGPPENFRNWACSIAYNVTRSTLREEHRKQMNVSIYLQDCLRPGGDDIL